MKGCRLRLHVEGECGTHPEPPLLLTLRRAWRVFLKHVATDKGRKKVPQMEGNHSKAGEVGGVALVAGLVSGSEEGFHRCGHTEGTMVTEK